MSTRVLTSAAVLAAATLAAAAVFASTVDAPTLRQMVDRADRIFVGEVTGVRSYWTGASIHTDVTFRASEVVKGGNSPVVMLTFLGGTVGEDTLEISGMPRFAVGDEQVVFAAPANKRLASPIIGMWHGRVRVSRDPVTRVARVLRHDGTPFERAAAVTERPAAASPTLVMPMRLDAFLATVRQMVREGAAK